jgi:Sulfotransferase family
MPSFSRKQATPSPRSDRDPVPFVVGVGRSGTTLMRMMLDAHPALAIPPETHFVPDLIKSARSWRVSPERVLKTITESRRWGDFDLDPDDLLARFRALDHLDPTGVLRCFYGLYAESQGKRRWGDKTPVYVTRMTDISSALPEAHFIHLIRDGRDVAVSRAKRSMRAASAPDEAARKWRDRILSARRQGEELPHYMEVRYEDLVLDTEPELRRVCEFIQLPWDESLLRYHERAGERLKEVARDLPAAAGKKLRPAEERMAAHALTMEPPNPDRVNAWRDQMSDADREAFEREAGELLAELGYETRAGQTASAPAGGG